MKCSYSWGTVNELVVFGILASINVSYINAAEKDPSKWVITEVYNENTLDIPSDPIFVGKSMIVLFHSINFFGHLLITMMQHTIWINCITLLSLD